MARRLASLLVLLGLGAMLPVVGGPLHLCLVDGGWGGHCCDEAVAESCCCDEDSSEAPELPCCIEVPELPEGLPAFGVFTAPVIEAMDLLPVGTCRLEPVMASSDVRAFGESVRPPPRPSCQLMYGVWRL